MQNTYFFFEQVEVSSQTLEIVFPVDKTILRSGYFKKINRPEIIYIDTVVCCALQRFVLRFSLR